MIRFLILPCALALLPEGRGARTVDVAPPAEFVALGPAWAGSSVNVVANRRHGVFTHGAAQFAGYYDPAGYMVLARRNRGDTHWQRHRTEHRGSVVDAHNAISLAVDGDGFLHVAWDHHGQPLNYARGRAPGRLELEALQPMVGRDEAKVTYPEFHVMPDGDLLCLYRDGESGRGRLILNRYERSTRTWRRVHDNLIDGEGARSPYWGAAVDRRGRLHLAWIWRESPDVATNHDLAYACSDDAGVHWQRVDGAPMAVPFTLLGSDYAVRVPAGHHLMNSPWVTADADGRPYLCTYWADTPESPPQFRAVTYAGDSWQVHDLTQRRQHFTLAGGATKRPPISRGVLLVDDRAPEPAVHLVYRDDALGGRIILRSTDRLGSGRWREQPLTTGSVDAWEPVLDPVRWQAEAEIHLLVQAASQRDGDDQAAAEAAPTTIGLLQVRPPAAGAVAPGR